MLVKIQVALLCKEISSTDVAKEFWKMRVLEKDELFQMIIVPPEAPFEGRNSNQSNRRTKITNERKINGGTLGFL